MRFARRHLAWIAAVWLVGQVSALAMTSATLCMSMPDTPGLQCTCAHEDGQPCPMHHPAKPASKSCSCRSTSDDAGAAMMSLFSPPALAVPVIVADVPVATSSIVSSSAPTAIDRLSPPDAPPPRS